MKLISLIHTTSDSVEALQKIAKCLVEERLAACVQILPPHHSTYHWQGHLESATEQSLNAKTTLELTDRVVVRIAELHNYAVPEISSQSTSVNDAYADWVQQETGPQSP